MADRIEISLPDWVRRVLNHMLEREEKAMTLAHLLPAGEQSPETTFRLLCKSIPALSRATSGMLSNWVQQQVFEQNADPVLSQLLASQPRTGLPGACAYAAYTNADLGSLCKTLGSAWIAVSADGANHPDLNSAGSELAPIDSLLQQAIAAATETVNELAGDPHKWLEHHNTFTCYFVLLLLTVTASRPVRSPFEDPRSFDLRERVVFIRDKEASPGHTGRLVPLPEFVTNALEGHLKPHLARLARIVEVIDQPMAQEIEKLARFETSESLPLFFLLSRDPEFGWIEVSERTMDALDLFKWPLPWNLMRHRAATKLRHSGLDKEIINGLMDHGEFGTASYGPFSARSWAADAMSAAPELANLLTGLDFRGVECAKWSLPAPSMPISARGGTALRDRNVFGARARALHRDRSVTLAREQAVTEIERKVGARPLDSLRPEEWEELSQQMLLTPKKLPHRYGSVRYQALRDWLQSKWHDDGVRPRLKRRYLPANEEAPPFTQDAVGAASKIGHARARLDILFPKLKLDDLSFARCLFWAGTSLILHSRVADPKVISDLLNRRNIRLVMFDGMAYIEHSQELDKYPDAPVSRYRIHGRTAVLLHRLQCAKSKPRAGQEIPRLAYPLHEALPTSASCASTAEFLSALATTARQANAMEHPGLVAGYLNGTVVTAGLSHADWVRCMSGTARNVAPPQAPVSEGTATGNTESAEDDDSDPDLQEPTAYELSEFADLSAFTAARRAIPRASIFTHDPSAAAESAGTGTSEAQAAAHRLFSEARTEIERAIAQRHSPREQLKSKLKVVLASNPHASSSCALLVHWLVSLLARKTRKGTLIRLSSVLRYFSAVSVCFEAVAYASDLAALDSEEVTQLYARIMDARRTVRPTEKSTSSSTADSAVDPHHCPETAQQEKLYRTWTLALRVLRDFHKLVRLQFDVEDPDWSEVGEGDDFLSISPGFILEKEYLHTLSTLVPDVEIADREALARAFILLTCYRFGLRGAEATGLMRDDWVSTANASIVVLVRSNAYRTLKSRKAQRQVPLLFDLRPLEIRIVDRFLQLWRGVALGDPNVALFSDAADQRRLMGERSLRSEVSQALREVTLNQDTTLHHARHSFANLVADLLLNDGKPLWPHATGADDRNDAATTWQCRRSHARKLLLCTDRVTRRSLWALARLLGHAHPRTSVRSYLHSVPDAAERCVWTGAAAAPHDHEVLQHYTFKHAISLTDLPLACGYLQEAPAVDAQRLTPRALTLRSMLTFLCLYQRGVAVEIAAHQADLEVPHAHGLVQAVAAVDNILSRHSAINAELGGRTNILGHVPDARWRDLIGWQMGSTAAPGVTWRFRTDLVDVVREMFGPSRQVLLYREQHFRLFSVATQVLGIATEEYRFVSADFPHPTLVHFAQDAGLPVPEAPAKSRSRVLVGGTTHPGSIKKPGRPRKPVEDHKPRPYVQVDSVQAGDPPAQVRHRIAVVPRHRTRFRDTFEFVLMLLVGLSVATPTQSEAGNSSSSPSNA